MSALHTESVTPSDTPLPSEQLDGLIAALPMWSIDGQHLRRAVKTADFATALAVVTHLGMLCERVWHHADFEVAWGRVGIAITTHDAGGLTRADFVLAAKMDQIIDPG